MFVSRVFLVRGGEIALVVQDPVNYFIQIISLLRIGDGISPLDCAGGCGLQL